MGRLDDSPCRIGNFLAVPNLVRRPQGHRKQWWGMNWYLGSKLPCWRLA